MLRYVQLRDEIVQMPGYHAMIENHRLTNSIHIFDTNYTELMQLIHFMEQSPEATALLSLRGHNQLREIDSEMLRRLHNFVAGAKSLIDHTRRIYNKYYKGANSFPEYTTATRDIFATDPLSQFVQDLREYCQHYRTLSLLYVTKYTRETQEEVREVALQIDDLLSYDGWSATAKQFFEGKRGNVAISKPIQDYHDKVLRFYEWFQREQYRIHQEDILEYKTKEAEMVLIQLEAQLNVIIVNFENRSQDYIDNPFRYIFSNEDMEELESIPLNEPNRASRVLALLNSYFLVPEHIKELIQALYIQLSKTNEAPSA
jgi:hypothetical protein